MPDPKGPGLEVEATFPYLSFSSRHVFSSDEQHKIKLRTIRVLPENVSPEKQVATVKSMIKSRTEKWAKHTERLVATGGDEEYKSEEGDSTVYDEDEEDSGTSYSFDSDETEITCFRKLGYIEGKDVIRVSLPLVGREGYPNRWLDVWLRPNDTTVYTAIDCRTIVIKEEIRDENRRTVWAETRAMEVYLAKLTKELNLSDLDGDKWSWERNIDVDKNLQDSSWAAMRTIILHCADNPTALMAVVDEIKNMGTNVVFLEKNPAGKAAEVERLVWAIGFEVEYIFPNLIDYTGHMHNAPNSTFHYTTMHRSGYDQWLAQHKAARMKKRADDAMSSTTAESSEASTSAAAEPPMPPNIWLNWAPRDRKSLNPFNWLSKDEQVWIWRKITTVEPGDQDMWAWFHAGMFRAKSREHKVETTADLDDMSIYVKPTIASLLGQEPQSRD